MNESINLVENRDQQLDKEQKILKFTRVIAVCILVTIASISILAFIISSQIPLQVIKQDQSSTMSEIAALHNKLATYYLIKNRISNIGLLLNQRKDYTKVISTIFSKISSDISIDGLNIEEKSFTLNISSNSLLPINKLINDMIDLSDQKKLIANVKLQSLSLNAKSQTYSLTLIGDLL